MNGHLEGVGNFAEATMALEHLKSQENPFLGKDYITVDVLTPENVDYLFKVADVMKIICDTRGGDDLLRHRVMANLFYEDSSRTSGSFWAAMQRLGGHVEQLRGMKYSSVSKGEDLPDTVRTFAQYADVVVLRHPEVGAARIAADAAEVPVINAGDGIGEHPTQALLDAYTIYRHFGRLDHLKVVVAGDVLNGRTITSLLKVLSMYEGNEVVALAPDVLQMDPQLKVQLEQAGLTINQASEMTSELVGWPDVWYHTRVQKERFAKKAGGDIISALTPAFMDMEPEEIVEVVKRTGEAMANEFGQTRYERVKHKYVIDAEVMSWARAGMILMHPLPRVGEIAKEVDTDHRAVYFEEVKNGMYVRMALLAAILGW